MRAAVTALALVATAWVALLSAAPLVVASGQADGDLGWWVASLYRATSLICHQRPERSFLWAGVPFPVCGRCVALYGSGAMGLMAAAWAAWVAHPWLAWPRRPAWGGAGGRAELTWVLASMSPAAVLFLLEWTIADPGTPARAIGSLPLGLIVGWLAGRELAGAHQ